MNWKMGINHIYTIDIYTLLYRQLMRNYRMAQETTQCSEMTYMGEKSKKRGDICMYIADSLCGTVET